MQRASFLFGIHFLNYCRPTPLHRTAPAKSANAWLTRIGGQTGVQVSSAPQRPTCWPAADRTAGAQHSIGFSMRILWRRCWKARTDNRVKQERKLSPSDLKSQIKALDEVIADHPANDRRSSYDEHATVEQRQELTKLLHKRRELVRQFAGVSPS